MNVLVTKQFYKKTTLFQVIIAIHNDKEWKAKIRKNEGLRQGLGDEDKDGDEGHRYGID